MIDVIDMIDRINALDVIAMEHAASYGKAHMPLKTLNA